MQTVKFSVFKNGTDDETTELELDMETINKIKSLKSMIDDLGDDFDEVIPVPPMATTVGPINVTDVIMQNVVDFCKMYEDTSFTKGITPDELTDEDTAYFRRVCAVTADSPADQSIDGHDCHKLSILACVADSLEIPMMLERVTKLYATLIKGNTPEDIRQMFNLPDDMTAEEKAAAAEEFKWANVVGDGETGA